MYNVGLGRAWLFAKRRYMVARLLVWSCISCNLNVYVPDLCIFCNEFAISERKAWLERYSAIKMVATTIT